MCYLSGSDQPEPLARQKGCGHRYPTATVQVTEAGEGQAYLVATGEYGQDAGQAAAVAYSQIAQVLKEGNLEIVQERVFGSRGVWPTVWSARGRMFQSRGLNPQGPLSYIQGRPLWGEGLVGVIIRAVRSCDPGDRIWTIRDRGRPMGRGWRRQGQIFLSLQNLQGLAPGANGVNNPPSQARRLFEKTARLLKEQGATYRDVARTWFSLSDILAWYPEFNQTRNAAYREFGLLPGTDGGPSRLPASTGIQGEAPSGAAVAMDILAVVGPPESRAEVVQLSSPGQPDAFTYGSAFSRGALIRHPDVSLIQVSGTAAIDARGTSLYPGDVRAQIDCTFDKIAALIGCEGASLHDIAAASVFVKRPEDVLVYHERAAARGLQNLPAVIMVADVCREELLFEMDAEVAFDP